MIKGIMLTKRFLSHRAVYVVVPSCAFGMYRVFSTRLRAKDETGDSPTPSVQTPVVAACHFWKKAFHLLFADHHGLKDLRMMLKSRFPDSAVAKLVDDSDFSPSLTKFLRGAAVVVKTIFADHGKPESAKSKNDDDDEDENGASEKGENEVEAENSVVRHSAKCCILTKKGKFFCTVMGEHDGEYESPSEERCFAPEFIKRHDFDKIFSDSEARSGDRKPTFSERKLINYENRLRSFSTPDKLFRYFATLASFPVEEDQAQPASGESHQHHHDQGAHRHDFHAPHAPRVKIYMNAEDFVRSISPGSLHPRGLGLDQYRAFDPISDIVVCNLDRDSIFYKISKDGLLKFSDYMFLLMVLTHPVRHFRMAFNLFDEEGDGTIHWRNFHKIEQVMFSQTKMGKDHRDHGENVLHKKKLSSRVAKYFFGEDLEGIMEVETFVDFQKQLKHEVNSLEFDAYRPDSDDSIGAMRFVDSMVRYMNGTTTEMNRVKKMKRNMRNFLANQKASKSDMENPRVSREDFLAFNVFLGYPILMKMAFKGYHRAGIKITRDVFKRNALNIAGVELSDKIVSLVFVMMGDYETNDLSERQFRKIVKTRTTFGLKTSAERPNPTKKLKVLVTCLGPQYRAFFRYLKDGDSKVCVSIPKHVKRN